MRVVIDQFEAFVRAAERMCAAGEVVSAEASFRVFVEEAQRWINRPVPVDAFHRFVELSLPIVVAAIKRCLPALAERAASVGLVGKST